MRAYRNDKTYLWFAVGGDSSEFLARAKRLFHTKSDTSTFVNMAKFVVLTIVDMAKPVMISTG